MSNSILAIRGKQILDFQMDDSTDFLSWAKKIYSVETNNETKF